MGRFVPVPTLNQTVLKGHLLMCVRFQLRWINLPFMITQAEGAAILMVASILLNAQVELSERLHAGWRNRYVLRDLP